MKKRSIIPKKPTIANLLCNYITTHAKHKGMKSLKVTRCNAKVIEKYFGEYVFDEIKPKNIIDYLNDRYEQGMKDNTIRREMGVFRASVQVGLDYELIEKFKPDGDYSNDYMATERLLGYISKFRPKAHKRKITPTHEQLKNILSKLPEDLERLAWVASRTAYRKDELLKLKWSDIDFDRKVIELKDTKNGEDRNTPMYKELYIFMNNLYISNGKRPQGWVFLDNKYKKMQKYNTYRPWRKAVVDAGYLEDGKHKFNFHDLRRYACRYLQEEYGFSSDMVISCYSGHKSKDIFEEIYNNVTPDSYRHFYKTALKN